MKQRVSASKKKMKNLAQFSGEWIALMNEKVVAHDKTLQNLMKKIPKNKLKKDPSVMLVPRKDECPYV
jgi:hypothetical protein